MCYPFMMLLTPYVLLRFLRLPYREPEDLQIQAVGRPETVVAALMLFYITVRIVGGWNVISNGSFATLDTQAGRVHVSKGAENFEIYNYVLAHTRQDDPILEIPDGGGISFATRRPSYGFTTLWNDIPLSEEFQALDLRMVQAKPPRVVIASAEEHFNSYYGVMGTNGCMFPSIAWVPNRLSWRPGFVFPAVRWIEENYKVDRRVGDWVLLLPK